MSSTGHRNTCCSLSAGVLVGWNRDFPAVLDGYGEQRLMVEPDIQARPVLDDEMGKLAGLAGRQLTTAHAKKQNSSNQELNSCTRNAVIPALPGSCLIGILPKIRL